MKILDTRTGAELKPGQSFSLNGRVYTLMRVEESLLKARGLFRVRRPDAPDREVWVDLRVRYTHPSFFLRKVAFVPS